MSKPGGSNKDYNYVMDIRHDYLSVLKWPLKVNDITTARKTVEKVFRLRRENGENVTHIILVRLLQEVDIYDAKGWQSKRCSTTNPWLPVAGG